jgi:hypothetical protein
VDPALRLWPGQLHEAVTKYGATAVNNAGVAALGYPAILSTKQYEFQAVADGLEKLTPEKETDNGENPA